MSPVKRVVGTCLAVLLMVQATGCTSWQAVRQPVPAAVDQHPNRRLRLTMQDGTRVLVDSARTTADVLVGYAHDGTRMLRLGEITEVRARRPSTGRTIGMILGVPLVAVLLVGVMVVASGGFDFSSLSW